MKKVFFTLALLVTTIAAQAQNNYHDALKAYLQACPSAFVGMDQQMSNALKVLNDELVKDYKGMTSEELANKYMKEQFANDLIDKMLLPIVQNNATIAEINELTAAMSTQEGKIFQEHQKQLNSNNGVMIEIGKEVTETVMAGETPTPVAVKSGIPQSYVNLYNQFYKVSGLNLMIAQMGNLFGDKKDTPEAQKVLKYFEENMATIYLNQSYGIMTTNDLNFGTKLFQTDAWKHMSKCTTDMMQNAQSAGMAIVMAYVSWLSEQGISLDEN